MAARLGDAAHILDFGCGVGILTTFYAAQYPEKQFVGVDRSPASIAVAREKAQGLGLGNLRFECVDVELQAIAGPHDLIVATHSLVQAEQDPGIPSQNWQTFERTHDSKQQALFEQRTGLDIRLDRLSALLAQKGRMIVFEKTRQLARRVPLQRALAARGLGLIEQPELVRYRLVEEVADDGPFYLLGNEAGSTLHWDESPEPDEGPPCDRMQFKTHATDRTHRSMRTIGLPHRVFGNSFTRSVCSKTRRVRSRMAVNCMSNLGRQRRESICIVRIPLINVSWLLSNQLAHSCWSRTISRL